MTSVVSTSVRYAQNFDEMGLEQVQRNWLAEGEEQDYFVCDSTPLSIVGGVERPDVLLDADHWFSGRPSVPPEVYIPEAVHL